MDGFVRLLYFKSESNDYLNRKDDVYVFDCTYGEREIAKELGFKWGQTGYERYWSTKDRWIAFKGENYIRALEGRDPMTSTNNKPLNTSFMGRALSRKPFPHQLAGCEWLVKWKRTIVADDMGLGKTHQSVLAINHIHPKRVLIICPVFLKLNWKSELSELIHPYDIHIIDTKKNKSKFDENRKKDYQIFIVNYDILTKFKFDSINWDVLICDEAHYFKNMKSKRGEAVHDIKGEYEWMLTGTPILNRPRELYSLIKKLKPNIMSKSEFEVRYCNGHNNGYGWDASGASNLTELAERLRENRLMLIRKKDEVLDLPEKTISVIDLDLKIPKEIDDWYSKKKDLPWNELAKMLVDDGNFRIPELGKTIFEIKHDIASVKVESICDIAKNILESKEKIVLFAHHRGIIDIIMEQLKDYNPVKLDGSMSIEDKDIAIKSFLNNPTTRVFIGSIMACGVGITLTVADTAIFFELPWNHGIFAQTSDRLHRIGQKNAVQIVVPIIKDSIDADFWKTIKSKEKIVNKVVI